MPPIPHVYLYLTASRLTLAGCRWKKTLDRTDRARLRGVSSCLTRKIDRKSCVFSGSFKPSSSSLPFSLMTSLRSVTSWRTRSSSPVPFFSPFSSAIPIPLSPSQVLGKIPEAHCSPSRFDRDGGFSAVEATNSNPGRANCQNLQPQQPKQANTPQDH